MQGLLENFQASVALVTGLSITGIMWLEMKRSPWKPFFWVTAAFTLVMPVFFLSVSGVSLRDLFSWKALPWKAMGWAFAACLLWEAFLFSWLYEALLAKHAATRRALWSIDAATHAARQMAQRIAGRGEAYAYGVLVFVWAPFAESLFYWGYLFRTWKSSWGAAAAATLVVTLFALRHALHFLPVRPRPSPAMIAFAFSTVLPALANCFLFKERESLVPLAMIHVAMNIMLSGLYLLREKAEWRAAAGDAKASRA